MTAARTIAISFIAMMQLVTGFAQNSISGRVIDAKSGSPIAGVFVSILHDSTMVAYCFSKEDGTFLVEYKDAEPEVISASIIGYAPFSMPVTSKKVEILMNEKSLTINAAKLTESVIKEKGDTISFMASAFKDKEDRVLLDLLKKLPGIQVTESGGILHNGSPINKFYVEGLDLMGGQYGVVTKNLPAEDVAQVDVYKRHQPVKVLKGAVLTDRSAINIVLKESARNTWLFSGGLASGAPQFPLFDAKAMVTRFSKASQDLYLLKGNNVGTDIMREIREQSYFGKTGAVLISAENIDSDFSSLLTPVKNMLDIPQEFWYDNTSAVGSFNHLRKGAKDSQVRLSLQAAAEKYKESSVTQEDVHFTDGNGLVIKDVSSMDDLKRYFSFKVNFEDNRDKSYFSDNVSISGQLSDHSASSLGGNVDYSESYRLPSLKIENNLESVVKTSKGRLWDISSDTDFILNNHSALYSTDDFQDVSQTDKELDINSYNRAMHTFRFGELSIGAFAGLDLTMTHRASDLGWTPSEGLAVYGTLTALTLVPKAGITTRYTRGRHRFYFSLPLYLNTVIVKDQPGHFLPVVRPSLSYELSMSQNWTLDAESSYSLVQSGAETLLEAAVMQNYRSLIIQDALKRTGNARAIAMIRYTDNPSMFYASLSGHIEYYHTDKTASSVYYGKYIVSSFIPENRSSHSFGGGGSVSKYFGAKALVASLDGSYLNSFSEEYLQGRKLPFQDEQIDVDLSLRTSALKWLSAEVKTEYSIDRVRSDSQNSGQRRIATRGSLIMRPLKPLSLYSEACHLWWMNSSDAISVSCKPIVKAGASWRFNKFSIFAECRNLLNATELEKEFFSSYKTVTCTYKLRAREYLVGIRMSL